MKKGILLVVLLMVISLSGCSSNKNTTPSEITTPVIQTPVVTTESAPNTPTPITTPTTINGRERIVTGDGKVLSFSKGDTVVGVLIVTNNKSFENKEKNVVLYNAPYSGRIMSGIINPWPGEITNQEVIHP